MSKGTINNDNNDKEIVGFENESSMDSIADNVKESETQYNNPGMVISKKKAKKSIIAIIIAAVVIVLLVAAYFIITAVKPKAFKHVFDSKYVMKYSYNGKEITVDKEKYAYWFNSRKYQFDQGDDSYWNISSNAKTFESIKDYAAYACKLYEIPYLMAEKENYTLTDEDKAAIEKTLQDNIKEAGGQAKFDSLLIANGISLDTYKYFLKSDQLKAALLDKYQKSHPITDEELFKKYNEQGVLVKHILISTDSVKDKDIDIIKYTKDVYDKAIAGNETFEQLIDQYNTDPGMKANPEGYFVQKDGQYVEEFQNAALGLKVGEISTPIETSYGYHIIKRYDATKYLNDNKEAFTNSYYVEKFSGEIQTVMNELDKTTKYANYYKKMKPDQFEK